MSESDASALSPYDVLGLKPGADVASARDAFKRLALQTHPDKGGDAAAFARLKSAFETITDPAKLQLWQRSQDGGSRVSASETVDIDAMAFDAARGCFMQPCRCGDEFVVPERMLELSFDTFMCPTCSCSLRVLYVAPEVPVSECLASASSDPSRSL